MPAKEYNPALDNKKTPRQKIQGVWYRMRSRCYDPKRKDFRHYGGRGIKICKQWDSFAIFYEWAATRWKEGLEIDRIENDGDYSPENCRFTTHTENVCNTRRSKFLEAFSEIKTVSQWARDARCVVGYHTLYDRIIKGISPETAITVKEGIRPFLKGEQIGTAKLSAEIIKNIRLDHSLGMGSQRLAKKYGIGTSTAKRIVNRQSWAHIL